MKKTKRYEEGGFTFADINEADRKAAIDSALADIDKRGVEQARDLAAERTMGIDLWSPEEKPAKRAAPKAKAEPARKEEKAPAKVEAPAKSEAPRVSGKEQVEVKAPQTKSDSRSFYPDLPKPKSAESPKSAMPNVSARKAATEERRASPRASKLGTQGVYSGGGKVSSASKRGDGCAVRGKTKGRMV